MKLTPWFPYEIKPVRSGWYETSHTPNGKRWWFDVSLSKWRDSKRGFICYFQDRKWRGVQK